MARIPNIVHYIFGMAPDFGGKPWSLMHHVCLMSAVERLKPARVLFHYEYEPSGPWWDLSRKLVTLMPMTAPREVFGKPLLHVAHRAGVVRLRTLIEHGGIYLDSDVFVQRSFADLLDQSTVLGLEGENGEYGTADAIILAEPNSAFLCRWLEEYRGFRSRGRDEVWAEHAVAVPGKLAKQFSNEVTLLPYKAFYWPLWTDDHLRWLYEDRRPIDLSQTYANHLWEARAWKSVKHLTPGRVRAVDTNFNLWARQMLVGVPDDYGKRSQLERIQLFADQTLRDMQTQWFRVSRRLFRKRSLGA